MAWKNVHGAENFVCPMVISVIQSPSRLRELGGSVVSAVLPAGLFRTTYPSTLGCLVERGLSGDFPEGR